MDTKKESPAVPKLLSIKYGTTLDICQPETRHIVVARAMRALSRGETVTWEDGSQQWHEVVHRVDLSKRGSKMYTWDKAGDKVKADVFLATKSKVGKVTKEKMGIRFVNL